jgi:hypothetical protein
MFLAALSAGGCADQILLYPSRDPIAVPGAASRSIGLQPDKSLQVWAARAPAVQGDAPEAVVLRFCGNAERAEWAVESECLLWQALPVEIWAVNYPGYGDSSGPASLSSISQAALAAFDAAHRQYPGQRIFVSGVSLGTAAALHVAAHRPVAGLILRNPPPLRQLILGKYGWWNLWMLAGVVAAQVPSDLDSVANARQVSVPGVFILSSEDEIVPPAYQQKVVEAYAGSKKTIAVAGAGHNSPLTDDAEASLKLQLGWLWHSAVSEPLPR